MTPRWAPDRSAYLAVRPPLLGTRSKRLPHTIGIMRPGRTPQGPGAVRWRQGRRVPLVRLLFVLTVLLGLTVRLAGLAAASAGAGTQPGKPHAVQDDPWVGVQHVAAVAGLLLVVGLVAGLWAVLVARRMGTFPEARRIFFQAVMIAALLATGGTAIGVVIADEGDEVASFAAVSIVGAATVAFVGAVVGPWIFLLARMGIRERAARVRAEERAALAAHLHDSVLQALTLIQKRSEDTGVRRLARGAERELRAWLYGAPTSGGDDFVAAVTAVAMEVEDRFDVTVELVTVRTCPLDGPARAVIGAVREALTNAAKHARVRRVSVLAEVAPGEVLVLVRDRGCGFDLATSNGHGRRGIADSIQARMRQHGGTATIRSTIGEGTEVELRMPVAVSGA
jgi:signal transduction histidine kinase